MEGNGARGWVLQIQRFCIHDGPGIRTCVFLKGCPLACVWCHNPESRRFGPELSYTASQCLTCGACAAACPRGAHRFERGVHTIDRALCTACGGCVTACSGALEIAGAQMSVRQVMDAVRADKPFYERSAGGLTLTGGEPLAQPAFAAQLAQTAKAEGISVCVETSGYAQTPALERVAQGCDLFLYDVKLTDDALHRRWTGVSNERILKNLKWLNAHGKAVRLRCILLPGLQDDGHWSEIARLAQAYGVVQGIDILPYHAFGLEKAERVGGKRAEPPLSPPSRREAQSRAAWLSARTDVPVRIL